MSNQASSGSWRVGLRFVAKATIGVALMFLIGWLGSCSKPPNCFTDTSPALPNATRVCCNQGALFTCGPWTCTSGFLDCNGDLGAPRGNGCECGPCQATCNGSTCGATFTITLGAGKECDALAPPACEKCAGTLTCGPDKDALKFKVCCAPHDTACSAASDCCKTGQGNEPPPFKGISCAANKCSFCSQKIGESCSFDSDCCAPLKCVDNQCRDCVPLTYVPCNQALCVGTDCPTGLKSESDTGCCDWEDHFKGGNCPINDPAGTDLFKPCCPPERLGRDMGDPHCGHESWCCTT